MLIGLCGLLAAGAANADDGYGRHDGGRRYAVTITNLTRGQVITPPVVIVHNEDFQLFVPGEAAIPELAMLAEEGATKPLEDLLSTDPSVFGATAASGPLFPGDSATVEVFAKGIFSQITVAGMLANSNDAFFAIRGERVPKAGSRTVDAVAYDAGSEGNLESCVHIPGPACGKHVRNPDGAEGFVHIHAGIHGIGDLTPEQFDWRNPVAEVGITPIR